ncbi:MAG: FAD-dependent oxidoreductase, partial [Turicibacter sp.]
VIGGGAVGLDVVEFFSERGAHVSIVERLPELARDLDFVTKVNMMAMIDHNKVDVLTSTSLLEVSSNNFRIERNGAEELLAFDYGFVCLGMRSHQPMLASISEYFATRQVEVINIGDSARARRIIDGVTEGRNITVTLEAMGAL